MAKSIHERVRATLAKQASERTKVEQAPIIRRLGARAAAETRVERGIDCALKSGIARTRREQRALDRELFNEDWNEGCGGDAILDRNIP